MVTHQLQTEQNSSAVVPPITAKRAGKPASHYEPSMIVHLPTTTTAASRPYAVPPWLRKKQTFPPSVSHSQPMEIMAATVHPASNLWSTPSYRPANGDIMACRAALEYEGEVMPATIQQNLASEQKDAATAGRPFHALPAGSFDDSSMPLKSDDGYQSSTSMTRDSSASVRDTVADAAASQLSHVCQLPYLLSFVHVKFHIPSLVVLHSFHTHAVFTSWITLIVTVSFKYRQ